MSFFFKSWTWGDKKAPAVAVAAPPAPEIKLVAPRAPVPPVAAPTSALSDASQSLSAFLVDLHGTLPSHIKPAAPFTSCDDALRAVQTLVTEHEILYQKVPGSVISYCTILAYNSHLTICMPDETNSRPAAQSSPTIRFLLQRLPGHFWVQARLHEAPLSLSSMQVPL